jgi:hypothetical protein
VHKYIALHFEEKVANSGMNYDKHFMSVRNASSMPYWVEP